MTARDRKSSDFFGKITRNFVGDYEIVDGFARLKSIFIQLFLLRIQLNSIFMPVSLDSFSQPVDSFYGQRELGTGVGFSLEQGLHRLLQLFTGHNAISSEDPVLTLYIEFVLVVQAIRHTKETANIEQRYNRVLNSPSTIRPKSEGVPNVAVY